MQKKHPTNIQAKLLYHTPFNQATHAAQMAYAPMDGRPRSEVDSKGHIHWIVMHNHPTMLKFVDLFFEMNMPRATLLEFEKHVIGVCSPTDVKVDINRSTRYTLKMLIDMVYELAVCNLVKEMLEGEREDRLPTETDVCNYQRNSITAPDALIKRLGELGRQKLDELKELLSTNIYIPDQPSQLEYSRVLEYTVGATIDYMLQVTYHHLLSYDDSHALPTNYTKLRAFASTPLASCVETDGNSIANNMDKFFTAFKKHRPMMKAEVFKLYIPESLVTHGVWKISWLAFRKIVEERFLGTTGKPHFIIKDLVEMMIDSSVKHIAAEISFNEALDFARSLLGGSPYVANLRNNSVPLDNPLNTTAYTIEIENEEDNAYIDITPCTTDGKHIPQ